MGVKLLVTGGYFDEGGEGVIHHVELDSGRVETWARWHPPERLYVPRKGFTGARHDGACLWVAAHAAIVRYDLARARQTGVLHQPDFNDLHDLALDGPDLLIANTGSDAVERISKEGQFIARYAWLPSWAQARRLGGESSTSLEQSCELGWEGAAPRWVPGEGDARYHSDASVRAQTPYHQGKLVDFVHPNHLERVGDEWVVTCLYDGSLRSLGDMRPRLHVEGRPHDGVVVDGALWLTTIDGGIWRAPLPLGAGPARRVAEAFALGCVGWCRGLLLTRDLIVVGLTQVRADRLPPDGWADADPRDSVTGLVVLERDGYARVGYVELGDGGRHHKIYSILELP